MDNLDWWLGYPHDSDDSGNLHMAASTTTSYFDVNYMGTTGYKISTPHIFAGLSKQWTILSSLGCAKTAAHPFSKPTCKWGSPIGLWTTLSYLHSQIAYTESIKPKKHQSIKQHKHTHNKIWLLVQPHHSEKEVNWGSSFQLWIKYQTINQKID